MIRILPVLLILAVLSAGIALALWRCVECPECPAKGPCLRCADHRRITLIESRRRAPIHPILRSLLRDDGDAALLGTLAEAQGLPKRQILGWKAHEEFFHYVRATQVEGPEGPLVLVGLWPNVRSPQDDSGQRVLIFARNGREMDRWDISMPNSESLDAVLQPALPASLLLSVRHGDDGMAPIVIASRSATRTLERNDWPFGWRVKGVARIVVREGRLEVTSP